MFIKSYLNYINEEKNIGLIYHYCSPIKAIGILTDNYLYSNKYLKEEIKDKNNLNLMTSVNKNDYGKYFISFTRDKNFHLINRIAVDTSIRIVLDGTKLSQNYKIVSFTAYPVEKIINMAGMEITRNDDKHTTDLSKNESEERIYTKYIKDINKYIISVDILKSNEYNKDDIDKLKKLINEIY